MKDNLNFNVTPGGLISSKLLARSISTFSEACDFVRQLPYGRNKNKADLITVFTDNCGTCSTKHALLKTLADENDCKELKLMMGIFKMHAVNTPKVAATLRKHQLNYIPEAHNYLKWNKQILDCTRKSSKSADFVNDLMEEIEIQLQQITDFKVDYHKQYLATWLNQQHTLKLNLDELWAIRERCILDLSVR